MHLHILDVDFVVGFSLMDIPVIMIMGFIGPYIDPHLGNLDIIEEGHVEALVLVLVVGLVLVFSLIEVVEVGVGIMDMTGIAGTENNKGVMIK